MTEGGLRTIADRVIQPKHKKITDLFIDKNNRLWRKNLTTDWYTVTAMKTLLLVIFLDINVTLRTLEWYLPSVSDSVAYYS